MKKKTVTFFLNSRALDLVNTIIETEDLEVSVKIKDTSLGDSVIEVNGETEEIDVLTDVYNMVY